VTETPEAFNRRGLSDEMRDMLDQSTREYVGWNPEDMPQFVGTVADIVPDCDCGGYGPHTILMVDLPNGAGVAVHAFHTTLRSQIEPKIKQHRLGVGDLIAISHLGTKQSSVKGHNDMNMYRVVTKPQAPPVRYYPTGEPEYDNR
jgi:hypothetical protein